ncbi:MAG: hypothetical protein ACUVXI_03630 [bacterium]
MNYMGRPYNEKIADAFGGVVIHSCGSVEHNLEILARTHGLIGLNVSVTETALPAVVAALKGSAVIIAHCAEATCNDLPQLTPEKHIRLCMQTFKEGDVRGIVLVMPLGITREEALALNSLAIQLARLN